MVRRTIFASLTSLLILVACQSVHPTSAVPSGPTNRATAQQTNPGVDFQGVKTTADIAKLAFVNKRCRLRAADGDMDIDQTCLVVLTVRGDLVVIP